MALLKQKHPCRDFFVLDISDVVPKDDTITMEHPLFSLATKPDMRTLTYENNGQKVRVIPSGHGLATIHDKDILIWAISKIIHAKNRDEPYSRVVRGSAHDLLAATNRQTNNHGYKRLKESFVRLRGTTFESDIPTAGKIEGRIFGLVDEAAFVYDTEKSRLDEIEIVLSEWMFRAVDNLEVVTISNDYFRLRRPLERRLYEIARKHCGNQAKWQIRLANLQNKTGSNAPLKKFRFNIHQIIEDDHTPFYRLELTPDDLVIFRPRKDQAIASASIIIPLETDEEARKIAIEKGWNYHTMRQNWLEWASDQAVNGKPVRNVHKAFLGWCRKQKQLR